MRGADYYYDDDEAVEEKPAKAEEETAAKAEEGMAAKAVGGTAMEAEGMAVAVEKASQENWVYPEADTQQEATKY